MTGPRPGAHVPGAGAVVGPGPAPDTSWAVPDDPEIAGTVVGDDGQVLAQLTIAEQATRIRRADSILRRGAVVTVYDIPTGPHPWDVDRVLRVHVPGCPDGGLVGERVDRGRVASDALSGAPHYRRRNSRAPAYWCPVCLGGVQ